MKVKDIIEELDEYLEVIIFNNEGEVENILVIPSMVATLKNNRLTPIREKFIKRYGIYRVSRIYIKNDRLGMWISE